jgi:uncharacterized protein
MRNIFGLYLSCALFFVGICNGEPFSDTPKLVVKGEASIFKPADSMEVSLGVVTSAETSSLALNENNLRIHQIMANLRALKLDDTDFETGRFHIRPLYYKIENGQEDTSRILGYEVRNHIQVKTPKVTLADDIIESAVQGGSNEIASIQFSLTNPENYREEVIQLAARYALADAAALSSAVGVRLQEILQVSVDHWQQVRQPIFLGKAQSRANDSSGKESHAIEAGQAEIHAVVNITFQIESIK